MGMSGKVVHFELPVDDPERASAFYSGAFGWQLNPMPGMGYTLVSTGPATDTGAPAEPGHINGGMMRRQGPYQHPIVTIEVEDMPSALRTVADHGGTQVGDTNDVGGMGLSAYFEDPEGNLIGLWQSLG
jgi:predicted enzyme related to lactoylglutathione lyase